jgi:hypothetical protein
MLVNRDLLVHILYCFSKHHREIFQQAKSLEVDGVARSYGKRIQKNQCKTNSCGAAPLPVKVSAAVLHPFQDD